MHASTGNAPHLVRGQLGFFVRSEPGTPQLPSHVVRAQLGFLCGVTPAVRTSEPLDELSARIFVRSDPRTGDTPRNPDAGAKDSSESIPFHSSRARSPLSHRDLSAIRAASTITL